MILSKSTNSKIIIVIILIALGTILIIHFGSGYGKKNDSLGAQVENNETINAIENPSKSLPVAILSNPQENKNQILDLKQQQKSITKKINDIESRINKLKKNKIDQTEITPVSSIEDEVSPEDMQYHEEILDLDMEDQANLLYDTIQEESRDPEWSNDAEQLLTEAVEDLQANINVVDINCRTSLCQMEIDFELNALEQGFQELNSLDPWSGELFVKIPDPNIGHAVIFIGRENYTLAKLY